MKTITYNPETHVLVARTARGVMQAAMEAQWEAGSHVDMAKREWAAAIAAAPQPESNPNWCAGCSPDNCSGCGAEPVESEPAMWVMKHIRSGDLAQAKPNQKALHPRMWSQAHLYTTPQPDRVAELEAALKVAREAIDALQNGLKWYQDAYPDSISEADHEEIAKVDAAIDKINEVLHD